MALQKEKTVKNIYLSLRKKYGKPQGQWRLWCRRPKTPPEREEVIIGALLAQNTNWGNVEKAIENLKKENLCRLEKIYRLAQEDRVKLRRIIRPSGFFRQKADYLSNLTEFFHKERGGLGLGKAITGEKESLRKKLLQIKGLGKETADSILLYGLDKPVFVVDEYTRKFVRARRLAKNFDYDFLRAFFEKNLPKNWRLFQDFQ